jgi:hypothetical protein
MNFLHISEIIECCQVEAIANKLDPTNAVRWQRFCRDYSKVFNTPYHQVLQMDPEFVILAVYEEQLDNVDVEEKMEELMDRVLSIEDPDYEKTKEQDILEFMRMSEEEEEERIKAGKPVFQKKKKSIPKKEEKLPENLPTSGGINLSYLEKLDREE